MVRDAAKYKADDIAQQERVGAKNELEEFLYNMKMANEDFKNQKKLDEKDYMKIKEKCEQVHKPGIIFSDLFKWFCLSCSV